MTAEDRMREQNEPDDPLLRALGEIERDHEQRHPGEWEDVLAGRVPAAPDAFQAVGLRVGRLCYDRRSLKSQSFGAG